jgi:hypothetical protein
MDLIHKIAAAPSHTKSKLNKALNAVLKSQQSSVAYPPTKISTPNLGAQNTCSLLLKSHKIVRFLQPSLQRKQRLALCFDSILMAP